MSEIAIINLIVFWENCNLIWNQISVIRYKTKTSVIRQHFRVYIVTCQAHPVLVKKANHVCGSFLFKIFCLGPKDLWPRVLSLPERFVGDPVSLARDNILYRLDSLWVRSYTIAMLAFIWIWSNQWIWIFILEQRYSSQKKGGKTDILVQVKIFYN